MKYIFFLLLFINQSVISQDSITISGQFLNNTRFSKVVVQKFGIGTYNVASIPIVNNSIRIVAPINTEPGVYRFLYSDVENAYIDVIINGREKEIDFQIDSSQDKISPIFMKSDENKKWYKYKNQEEVFFSKINALQLFLSTFPDQKAKVWINNNKEYKQYQVTFDKERKAFLASSPGYWAKSMVSNNPVYFPDISKHWKIQEYEAREQFWKNIDVEDLRLQNTPLYSELILEYLKYYMNPEMKFTEQEMVEGFIKSADEIMRVFSINENSQKFALQFLQLGFREMGQEEVLRHLDERYALIASQCQDDKNREAFEARMAGYKAMQKGAPAPNIKWMLSNGKEASLMDFQMEKVVLVFWASWCPHCLETMPKINEWAKKNPNISVLAVSLDFDFKAYQNKAIEYNEMYHYCDYKQWESEPVQDYYVYGTPTIILIDENKNIEAKFSSEIEFFNYFN
jgi:thiol-disulfide isomerase/thioredoxin